MLRISKLADYGAVVMAYLACRTEAVCSAREIATHTHLSVPTVSKLLKRLLFAGLLVSVRGANGGYKLQRDATTISVADILYAVDKPRGLTACSLHPHACMLTGMCHMQSHWQVISQVIDKALSEINLAMLAKTKAIPELPGVASLFYGSKAQEGGAR